MRESAVENYVVRRAEAAGWEARKVSWIGRRGAPDRVFLGHARCVFIEFKAPGKEIIPGSQQDREFRRLQAAYPEVYTTDSAEEALRILGIKR